jgi:hypothetical protein
MLGKLYSEMIFIRGFIHSDPHPGNVLVRRAEGARGGEEIVLLDHGLYVVSAQPLPWHSSMALIPSNMFRPFPTSFASTMPASGLPC